MTVISHDGQSLTHLAKLQSRFIDIVLRSIESVLNFDFDDYEVVIVDNASSDGSFEVIKKFVEGGGRQV